MNNEQILVGYWMSTPVRTVTQDTSMADAYETMMHQCIRRLPVVDSAGRLIGIVSLGDLREARPSPATGLSIYELNYMLSKLTVGDIMTHNPFTLTADMPIQCAARIMLDRKVGGLPVVDEGNKPVGIITESDVFRMLTDQWDKLAAQSVEADLVA